MSAELKQRVEDLEQRVEDLEEIIAGASVTQSDSDMETFLERTTPGTHVERVTAIGYYLVHEEGETPFTIDEVKQGYEDCRIPKPANLSDVLAGAEENGWVMRQGTRGKKQLWTVTRDGDKAVESGFEQ